MRTRLLALEKYVVVRTAYGVAAALAVISAIITLADFVSLSRDVGVRAKESGVADLFGLTLLQSPSVILILMPFAFLFGVLGAFVSLNRRSELIAMRAAGVSAWRFILPAAGAAALAGVAVVLIANPIASLMNAQFERSKAAMMDGYLTVAKKPIWLRQGDGRTQAIIRADGRADGPGLRLRGVSVWTYAVERRGAPRFLRRIDAREVVLEPGQWRLIDAQDGAPGQPAARFATETLPTTLTRRTASGHVETAAAVPFWSLPGVIGRTQRAGLFHGGLSPAAAAAAGDAHALCRHVDPGCGLFAAAAAAGRPGGPGGLGGGAGLRVLLLQPAVLGLRQGGVDPAGPRRLGPAASGVALGRHSAALHRGRVIGPLTRARPRGHTAGTGCAQHDAASPPQDPIVRASASAASLRRHATAAVRGVLFGSAAALALGAGAQAQNMKSVLSGAGGVNAPVVDDGLGPRDVYLQADELIDDRDRKTVTAIGSVEARYQGRTLRAKRVIYDTVTGAARATGDVVIINADGTSEYGQDMQLDDQFRTGVALGFAARMQQNVTIAAGAAIRRTDEVSELRQAVYTPCPICKADGVTPITPHLVGEGQPDHPGPAPPRDLLPQRHPAGEGRAGDVLPGVLAPGPHHAAPIGPLGPPASSIRSGAASPTSRATSRRWARRPIW